MGENTDIIETEEDTAQVEGWINVWEVDHCVSFHGRPYLRPIWEPHFCMLNILAKRISHHRSEKIARTEEQLAIKNKKKLRLDGGKKEFDKKWGYGALECIREHAGIQDWPFSEYHDFVYGLRSKASLDVFAKSQTLDDRTSKPPNSSYDKGGGLGERRGSVPAVSSAVMDDGGDGPNTPSRLSSFFSRKGIKSNLKRTKSVTKLDRKRSAGNNDLDGGANKLSSLKRTMSLGRLTRRWTPKTQRGEEPPPEQPAQIRELPEGALINHHLRSSRSHESLLQTNSAMHSIDLAAGDVEIKPLHSSILGQEHCFQVSTSHGSKYYSCRTAEERQQWIQCLRKSVHPKQEQTMRTDNSLKLWVIEAKNCTAKKKYFCEVCLDKTLYARTSSKQKNDMLFWGEQFEFGNLPEIETVTVNFYREADKKKKKEKNQLLGYIKISLSEFTNRQLVEKWYTASSGMVGKSGKENKQELPILRIKIQYQTVSILPMHHYSPLLQYIKTDYATLVDTLEPLIAVKAKEEIARAIVSVLQRTGGAEDFLMDIVMAEVDKLDNENLTFRGNSIATKAMEAYMKLVGQKYLRETLGELVRSLLEANEDCEVDPARVPNNAQLIRQQQNLTQYAEMVWYKVINSHNIFPSELARVFSGLKERCEETKRPGDLCDHLISACIFLRFLCPAILSPSLFGLTQEFPQALQARALTLMAKTVQNVANFTKFGAKEEYMTFMNDFVERELDNMHQFLKHISTCNPEKPGPVFDGCIDLGKELSVLHTLLLENLEKITDEAAHSKLDSLERILSDISLLHEEPAEAMRKQPGTPLRIYDNLNTSDSSDGASVSTQRMNTPPVDAAAAAATMSLDRSMMQASAPDHRGRRTSLLKALGGSESADDEYVMISSLARAPPPRLSASQRSLTSQRPDEVKVTAAWQRMVTAAEMVNGNHVDLVSFADDEHRHAVAAAAAADGDSCSQLSLGQLSTIGSSGYQSFGYSQSSSPIDTSSVSTEQFTPVTQPLSFANPMFQHEGQNHSRVTDGPTFVLSSSSLSSEEGSPAHRKSSQSKHSPKQAVTNTPPTGQLPNRAATNTPTAAPVSREVMHTSLSPAHRALTNTPPSPVCKDFTDTPPSPPPRRSSHSHIQFLEESDRSLPRRPSHPHLRPDEHRRSPSSSSCDSLTMSLRSQDMRPRCLSTASTNSVPRSPKPQYSHHGLVSPPSPAPGRSLTMSQLSRSSEFPISARHPPSPGMLKRTITDTAIVDSASNGDHAYPRRAGSQNTVRMGVRSVQHHQAMEASSKSEYEAELTLLREQLAETQAMLAETQERLLSSDSSPKREADGSEAWSRKYEDNEERYRREKEAKEEHIKALNHRLFVVEDRFRQEQLELHQELKHKQSLIDAQERRLLTLNSANARLLGALNQLKERQSVQTHQNGLPPASAKITLTTDSARSSSSC